jgi:predicted 3-demethylubiquinone-9 3-methyltransferase (glyoxalase superfamily)
MPQKITPHRWFDAQAEEAAKFYAAVFDRSEVYTLVPYEPGEGEKQGAVKHAAISLDGAQFITMDSGLDHRFSFTPAISFLVGCRDQAEIDRYWHALSAVPQAEQCGWLQDKFGVSWQIVPETMDTMMKTADPERAERVMKAVLQMKKLDVARIAKAFELS